MDHMDYGTIKVESVQGKMILVPMLFLQETKV